MDLLFDVMPILMFGTLILLLFSGFPVAFALGAVGIGAAWIGIETGEIRLGQLSLVVNRTYSGVIENLILAAIPMFIFMGTMLEASGIARDLLSTAQRLLRRTPGGLALSVVVMGTIMAATTGIIGASVVMMTLIALPTMAEKNYDLSLSAGTIAASGTLGILIPPSIMLVVIGDMLSLPVGHLFLAALLPGLMLAGLYLLYILVSCSARPSMAPRLQDDELGDESLLKGVVFGLLPASALILLVLGSIFGGFATPTEASGIGALGATLLALLKGKLNLGLITTVCRATATTGAMLFMIFIGATAFSLMFRLYGGEDMIVHFVQSFEFGSWGLLVILMAIVFLLGFFFDWIEITLIVLPIFTPILEILDFGTHVEAKNIVLWFAILVSLNLQTSFLTPPFGFALFYLKGAANVPISTKAIYKGILPFVGIQLLGLGLLLTFPDIALWLPEYAFEK